MAYRKKRKKKEPTRYVNQQAVYIHKLISHKKQYYFNMDISKCNEAMRKLSGSAYKMYVYLCQNRDGHNILLSGKDFCKATGLSDRSYILAKRELIEKHYLHLREDGDFNFYNYPFKIPTKEEQIINDIVKKIKADKETELQEN